MSAPFRWYFLTGLFIFASAIYNIEGMACKVVVSASFSAVWVFAERRLILLALAKRNSSCCWCHAIIL